MRDMRREKRKKTDGSGGFGGKSCVEEEINRLKGRKVEADI